MKTLRTVIFFTLPFFASLPAVAESADADLKAMAERLKVAEADKQPVASPPDRTLGSQTEMSELDAPPVRSDLVDFQLLARRTQAWGDKRRSSTKSPISRRLSANQKRFQDLFPLIPILEVAPIEALPNFQTDPCGGGDPEGDQVN